MHRDPEPGREPTILPPFVAGQPEPGGEGGDARPLPPWTSAGRDLPGSARPAEPTESAQEAPWTPVEPAEEPEPWSGAPEPTEAAQEPFPASEPWPGDEAEEPETAGEWVAADSGSEPWAAEPPSEEPEPLVLDEADWEPVGEGDEILLEDAGDDEPFVLDAPATPGEEPWLELGEAAEIEPEPWSASASGSAEEPWPEPSGPAPMPWAEGVVLDEAEPVPEDVLPGWEPAPDRPAEDLPPTPPSPLDELVETAGQALAGSEMPWDEAPLATWPGEAEAWDAAAVGSGALTPEPEVGEAVSRVAEMAEHLERLAADLRVRGAEALTRPSGEPLGLAVAAFLAGWRAARAND